MRALTTILFATTTLLSGAAATAAPADQPTPNATVQKMAEMEGSYILSDGRRARMVMTNSRLYLDVGGHQQELVSTGPDTWAARDGSLSMRYKVGQAVDEIVIDYRSDLRDAAPIRVAARDQRGRGGVE